MTQASDERARFPRAIVEGAELAGALTGAAVGQLGGSEAALGGAAAGWAIVELGREVIGRMSARAGVRAAAAASLIQADAREHEIRGETPRRDGFFDERGALRPEAHELLEGILLAAANSFEERKLPYLAHLFVGVAHDANVPPADALFLTRVADQLTYRQLQGLAAFGRRDAYENELIMAHVDHAEGRTAADPAFLQEFNDLGARGLVGVMSPDDGVVRNPAGLWGPNSLGEVEYGTEHLTAAGESLYRLMRLSAMPAGELERWIVELRGQPTRPAAP